MNEFIEFCRYKRYRLTLLQSYYAGQPVKIISTNTELASMYANHEVLLSALKHPLNNSGFKLQRKLLQF